MSEKKEGLRFNAGKTRHDLVPAFAQEQYARVLTKGAEKYAPHNWRKGMAWSKVIASTKRHLNAIESGEDFDPETGLLHSAHVQCNAAFLTEYYKIAPEFDDRPHQYLSPKRVGLDIDEVLADWVSHWASRHSMEIPTFWTFDRQMKYKFDQVKDDKDFWLSIPTRCNPSDLRFEPVCYITSRDVPGEWTEQWLDNAGFPAAPVLHSEENNSKGSLATQMNLDIFVDDHMDHFIDVNNHGVCCYLMDAPHNRRYNVGHKRLFNLGDLLA